MLFMKGSQRKTIIGPCLNRAETDVLHSPRIRSVTIPCHTRDGEPVLLRTTLKLGTPLAFLVSALLTSTLFAQGGQTGLSFLKLGVGARSIAMGEAYTAIANDASATYYNPAGLAQVEKTDIMVMHKEWFEGVRTEFLGVRVPLGRYALGLSINTTNISGIELRTRPGPPEGTFSSHDFALGLSFATRVSSSLKAGLSAKFLYEKIFVDEASGAAIDLGLLYELPLEGMKVGASASNLGSMGRLGAEKIKLPALLRVGSSYSRDLPSVQSTVTAAADVVKVFKEDKAHLHTGAEVSYHRTVSVRLGYLFGYEARGITVGIGMMKALFRLDYAFSPHFQSLDAGHTISLGVEF